MLGKKMQEALNAQINAEQYSSYLYLSMAAWADKMNLKGFGQWFRVQATEELIHVTKFFNYVLDRRGEVVLQAVAAPPIEWKSPEDVFEATLTHEQHVTSLIHKLSELAVAEKDHATRNVIEWFIAEQVEEEAAADDILNQIKLTGTAPAGLFMIDRELGTRSFMPVPTVNFPPTAAGGAA
jgi:ferritin